MEQYIGHILTAIGLLVGGAVGWGILKNKTDNNTSRQDKSERALKEHDQRIRDVEVIKPQWEEHRQNASRVMERLNSIDSSIAEIENELRNRGQADERLQNILEANRMVLTELSQELAVIKALRGAQQ